MKVFEFEQNLKNEYKTVNIIYKYSNEKFAITTLKNRSCLNEVKKNKRVAYDSLDELIEKSEQYSKHKSYVSFLVDTSKHTDASKWEVIKITKRNIIVVISDKIEVFGNFKKCCKIKGFVYNTLKMKKFPIVIGDVIVHKKEIL